MRAPDLPAAIAQSLHARGHYDISRTLTDQASQIAAALAWLIGRGHIPIAFHTADGSRPTVQLAASPRLAEMVDAGTASYFKWTAVGSVPSRHGMFNDPLFGARVVWVERGH